MAVFDPSVTADDDAGDGRRGDPAYRLLAESAVTLFWRPELLHQTVAALRAHGYQIVSVDASSWTADDRMHAAIADALAFPDYYGRNLDALNDCLRDVIDGEYGWARDGAGLVLVFTGYHVFAAHRPRSAQLVLDIIASRARGALLLGRRLICLVQSDDPAIEFDPVGAQPVAWNDREWPAANRQSPNP
jgi:Barstar (barnase inhibitor)